MCVYTIYVLNWNYKINIFIKWFNDYWGVHCTFLWSVEHIVLFSPTVRKKSCLHPPVRKRKAISGRMRICLAKWSVWTGSPLETKRRPRGILLWWAHSLPSFTALGSISMIKWGGGHHHCCRSSGSLTALCHFNCARLCNLWQDYVIEFISTLIEFQTSKKIWPVFPQMCATMLHKHQFDVFSLFQSISFRPPLTLNHC